MSFVLQLFHAPQLESVDAAVAYIERGGNGDQAPAERFARFVAAITQVYPDRSGEDEDGDDESNIWPEGVVAVVPTAAFVNIAVKTDAVDLKTLATIADKARAAGLQMLDPQNAMLYRADGTVVGQARPVPAKPQEHERRMPGLRERLARALNERLGPAGFALVDHDNYVLLSRQHGDIRQIASIGLYGRGPVEVDPSLWLAAPALSSIWVKALPPYFSSWKQRRDRLSGGVAPDFEYGLADLAAAATEDEAAQLQQQVLDSVDDEARFERFLCAFATDKLLPVLEPIRDLDTLATVALTDDAIDVASRGRMRPGEQLAMLVLAHLARPALFERLAAGLMQNPNRNHEWRDFHDDEGRFLGQLIAHLRQR